MGNNQLQTAKHEKNTSSSFVQLNQSDLRELEYERRITSQKIQEHEQRLVEKINSIINDKESISTRCIGISDAHHSTKHNIDKPIKIQPLALNDWVLNVEEKQKL